MTDERFPKNFKISRHQLSSVISARVVRAGWSSPNGKVTVLNLHGLWSRDLANANAALEQKMRAMKLMMGFRWTKKAIRAVGATKISGLA